MSKLPLSVVIMAHRSDDRLRRCLASVTFADEIIVLDDNSGQDWRKYPSVKVVAFSCPLDFSAVRNQGLTVATHEWVLFLDSDEVLDQQASTMLPAALENSEINGYYLPRIDWFKGRALKYGEVGNVQILRLVRKSKARFVRQVHEVAQVQGKTANFHVKIDHFPHKNVSEFVSKVNNYARIEASSRPPYSQLRWWTEVICFPLGKFVVNFFGKLGCLDGWRGLVYAYCMSLHSLLVRMYVYEQQQTN